MRHIDGTWSAILDHYSLSPRAHFYSNIIGETQGLAMTGNPVGNGPVKVLYMCDFVPGNTGGGALLMERLLSSYPREAFTLICGSKSVRQSHTRPGNTYYRDECSFPAFSARGRWGLGRLLSLLDWLSIPVLAVIAMILVRLKRIEIILSVAHGHFFIAGALVSRLLGTPFVLWVHDDWVAQMRSGSYFLKYFASHTFRFTVQSASRIYAISDAMAGWLRSEYDVDSEVQMPARESALRSDRSEFDDSEAELRPFRIAFAGTNNATAETVGLLVDVVSSGLPSEGRPLQLDLYMPEGASHLTWRDRRGVTIHRWLSQSELEECLCRADLLFLPYEFSPAQAHICARSFPTKASDYMACGRPILIMAPASSAIVQYARRYAFADIVDEPSTPALLASLLKLIYDPAYCAALGRRAREVFEENHDIVKQRESFHQLLDRLASPARSGPFARQRPPCSAFADPTCDAHEESGRFSQRP